MNGTSFCYYSTSRDLPCRTLCEVLVSTGVHFPSLHTVTQTVLARLLAEVNPFLTEISHWFRAKVSLEVEDMLKSSRTVFVLLKAPSKRKLGVLVRRMTLTEHQKLRVFGEQFQKDKSLEQGFTAPMAL
jgi:hypothetical protein